MMKTFRIVVVLFTALTLAFGASTMNAANAGSKAKKYAITVKYVEDLDEVHGTAKNVKGTWHLVLEQRADKDADWRELAQNGPHKGKKKQTVANKVEREEPFDFRGQWRTCVVKNIYEDNEKRTCGKGIVVE